MAVTKQTYTATATWTASQLAGIFRSAFIDAGLMTEWHSSFLSGSVENRVLAEVYDGTKTYGTTYYWFKFTTSGVFLHTALVWTANATAPGGTQYLDFFQNTTNATTNHRQMVSLSTATTVTLTRYTSAYNPSCTWFLLRNGSTSLCFTVANGPNFGPTGLVDLNRMAFSTVLATESATTNNEASILFRHISGSTRRTQFGTGLRGDTGSYYSSSPYLSRIRAVGNANSNVNWSESNTAVGLLLPTAHANSNTALAADHTPVFTGIDVSGGLMAPLPSDFGFAAYYASTSMVVQDTLTVTAGSEEWEILHAVTQTSTAGQAQCLFVTRIVGG